MFDSGVLTICERCIDMGSECAEHEGPPVVCFDCGKETQPEEWGHDDRDDPALWVHAGCAAMGTAKTCPHCGGVLPDAG